MSRNALADGLAELHLELSDATQDKLLAFRDLLLKWNRTYNLTALRDPAQAISHHLLDSLAIVLTLAPERCWMSAAVAACPAFLWPSPGLSSQSAWSTRSRKGHLPAAGQH